MEAYTLHALEDMLHALEDMIHNAAPGCPGDARAKLGWILDVNRHAVDEMATLVDPLKSRIHELNLDLRGANKEIKELKALKKVKKVAALRAELNEADCAHHRVKEELKDLKKALGQLYRGESPCVCDSY